MRKVIIVLFVLSSITILNAKEVFPDGSEIPDWFRDYKITDINKLGKQYIISDFSVINDSTVLQTQGIQAVIDKAAETGGVVVIPKGTFLSGSLFFKPGTHLHLREGAVLKGSDDISNFPLINTRIEGQSLKYFAALINADRVNGFTISGKGTVNGNGLRYWKAFWLRRQFNPLCTNMDEMRPRLVYISNSKDVQLSGVNLINSPFWTTHFYKCENVKLLNLTIFSPESPVKAPSTDAVDIDVCSNVLIKNCYFSVNDDAVALKGGKGPTADKNPDNGGNYNIIIEDCIYGFCHGVLTCGSESIHNRNIILRRIKINKAQRLLWLKMRPDTPQKYEYIMVEDISGDVANFLFIRPWTQFFDLKGQTEMPLSYSKHVTMRNINLECETFFNVGKSDQYILSDFVFENLNIKASKSKDIDADQISGLVLKNVKVEDLSAYLLVYFTDPTHGLFFAFSNDGYNFKDVNKGKPVIAGDTIATQKGIRDPHITRGPDGAFYLAMTDLHLFGKEKGYRTTQWERGENFGWGNNRGFVLMKSFDLINWTRSNVILNETFPLLDVGCAWAPETIYDPKEGKMMIYFTMRLGNGKTKMYYSYTDNNFTKIVTEPKLLFDYPNPEIQVLDADITALPDGRFVMTYVAQENPGGIKMAFSDKINEGYIYQPEQIDFEPRSCEAPNVWKRNGEQKWVLMYDIFSINPHNFGFAETTDFKTFTNIGHFNGGIMKSSDFSASPKHGAIIQLTKNEAERLAKHWKVEMN